MKRLICLLLVSMFILLSACHYSESGDILEPVAFYYPRTSEQFVYGAPDGVLAAEMREASGHVNDLEYLIAMYLRGPQDEGLRSPVRLHIGRGAHRRKHPLHRPEQRIYHVGKYGADTCMLRTCQDLSAPFQHPADSHRFCFGRKNIYHHTD